MNRVNLSKFTVAVFFVKEKAFLIIMNRKVIFLICLLLFSMAKQSKSSPLKNHRKSLSIFTLGTREKKN